MDYVSTDKVRDAVEEKLGRSITDKEWEAITDIILYEIKGAFYLLDEDLDYDMERIKKLLKLML